MKNQNLPPLENREQGSTRHFEINERQSHPGKSLRPKSVTHVAGTFCNPCLRVGHNEKMARPERFELPTLCFEVARLL
jgi:hypothetical protein